MQYLMANRLLGGFENLLLLAILRLDDRAYGVAIRQELIDRAVEFLGPTSPLRIRMWRSEPFIRVSTDWSRRVSWSPEWGTDAEAWLYKQDVSDLNKLPGLVNLGDVPVAMPGYRRPGLDRAAAARKAKREKAD
jgi:hypothetical protein